LLDVLASFPVGEAGTNVTTVTFGHRSGKLLATGSEDDTIHIYLLGQMTSLLVKSLFSSHRNSYN
jgi:WD40 repeat protein